MRELVPHYLQDTNRVCFGFLHCCALCNTENFWCSDLTISSCSSAFVCLLLTFLVFLIVQERLDYLEDGKNIFKLRLRLCSSLYPINERIRDFFLEYDRHTLRTSPPWGSELLEVFFPLIFTKILPATGARAHIPWALQEFFNIINSYHSIKQ